MSLPPVMVMKPLMPSRSSWSRQTMPREMFRPVGSLSAETRGRTPAYARRIRVEDSDGASLAPSVMRRFTSSGVTATLSHSSNGMRVDVVPITHTVSPGTRISALEGFRQRFMTMLFTLWAKMRRAPFAGYIPTFTPAIAAMPWPQMPQAFTVTGA